LPESWAKAPVAAMSAIAASMILFISFLHMVCSRPLLWPHLDLTGGE
jgi:hypothetical protein